MNEIEIFIDTCKHIPDFENSTIKEFFESGEDLSLAFNEINNKDSLELFQYFENNPQTYNDFKYFTVCILKHSNTQNKQTAFDFIKKIENNDKMSDFVFSLKEFTSHFKPSLFFERELDINDISSHVSDLVSDFLYYNRKSDEDFSVNEARKFFSKDKNIDDFLKLMKKEIKKQT